MTNAAAAGRRSVAPVPEKASRQSAWLLGARVVPHLYLLGVSIVVARTLGAEGMGRQSFIAFIAAALVTALTAGLPLAVMRYVSERAGAGDTAAIRALYAWHGRLARWGACLGAIALALAAARGAAPQLAWLLAGAVVAATVLHTVPSALLNGLGRWKDATIAGVVTGACTALLVVIVLVAGGGISGIFAAEALGAVVSLWWTHVLARRALRLLPAAEPTALPIVRSAARFAALASVSVVTNLVIWQRSAIPFLAHFAGDAAVATFSVAFAAMIALRMPFDVTAVVMTTAVAHANGAGANAALRGRYRQTAWLTLVASVPATVAAFVLGPSLLAVVFGDALAAAGPVFAILVVAFPVIALGTVSTAFLHGLARQRSVLWSGTVAAACALPLYLAFVPRFGSEGAAWISLSTQCAVSAWIIAGAIHAIGRLGLPGYRLGGLALASAIAGLGAHAGLVLVGGGGGGVLLGAIVFVLLWIATVSVLRVLDAGDRDHLRALWHECVR